MAEPTVEPSPRERLLDAGAELFAERGFAAVSVREVCAAADTSANMIHHYFGSKQGLLDAVTQRFSDEVFAVPMQLLQTPARSQDDFASRLDMLFRATLDAYVRNRAVVLVAVQEGTEPEALPHYMTQLASFLSDAQKQGLVRAEVDPEMITGLLLDRILNQVRFAPWIRDTYGIDVLSDPDYQQRWTRANVDVYLHGIAAD